MSQDASQSPLQQDPSLLAIRNARLVSWATGIGLVLALIALIDGLWMLFTRELANCPEGTYFPEGATNFDCYVHPQAGLGIAIASFSVVLAILVVFASIMVRSTLTPRPPSP
ncbi:hypothetical protein [Tessaracoccus antarcticus]|uniref:Vitamin K epoxide reductase domain-containing protein n=1 Tax=Tessaracoccus antarcticus TaxID=2479848 RepID=A0A3M0GAX1_9ACTN|nr:hypothetical protein [Tessaracoccus antarcticus]RMB62165.1 hypothetical protein EAX62_06265 [Tessaracoccus antarcticus]